MKYAIETKGLSKTYGEVSALQDLDLQVPQNTIFGFLGPNGAGKSTTIKLLLGLIQPTMGTAELLGMDIERQSLQVRQQIGYLAQHPRFYPYMTAREVLEFSGSFFIGDSRYLRQRAQEMLELVGLEGKADRRIGGFSGGETQRLGIAQAQIHNPELLILDEPAAALDPMGREKVLQIMEQLRAHSTIFFSTHILDDVQRVSDEVAILNHGKLVAHAPTSQLLASGDAGVFKMTSRGESETVRRLLEQKSWISQVELDPREDADTWRIMVTDEAKAEQQLLRAVLSEERVQVLEFGRQRAELEEIFMRLVNGEE